MKSQNLRTAHLFCFFKAIKGERGLALAVHNSHVVFNEDGRLNYILRLHLFDLPKLGHLVLFQVPFSVLVCCIHRLSTLCIYICEYNAHNVLGNKPLRLQNYNKMVALHTAYNAASIMEPK